MKPSRDRIVSMSLLRTCLITSALLSSSCFVVTDLGRFKKADELAPSNFSDLKVTVRGFTSHVNEQFEYRVVDKNNAIQSRGFIIPLGGVSAEFSLKGAIPKQNGPFHFDFYADHDNSKGYDKRPDTQLDHSWRLPLEDNLIDANGTYVIVFDHNTSFTNLNNPAPAVELGKGFTVHMKGLAPFQNKRVEVRISDASTKRGVGMFRVPVVTVPEYDVVVPGMIEPGVSYAVEVYTDDGTGAASSILAYRFEIAAPEAGIEATFDAQNPAGAGGTVGATQVFDALPP